ncbi:hypothetical protein TNCV_1360421, partial [Trichonephila clavipes]
LSLTQKTRQHLKPGVPWTHVLKPATLLAESSDLLRSRLRYRRRLWSNLLPHAAKSFLKLGGIILIDRQ